MIAPQGFLHFGEILDVSRWYARDLCWAFRTRPNQDDGSWRLKQEPFERDAVQSWMITQLALTKGLYLCSVSGVPLRCSSLLVNHQDQLESLPCPIPIEESTLSRPTDGKTGLLRNATWFISRFLYFDNQTGMVLSKEAMEGRVPDISGFSDSVQQELQDRDRNIREGLSQFAGFSVCIEDSALGETEASELEALGVTSELAQRLNQGTPNDIQVFDERASPRLRVRDQAKEAYEKLFPEGHEQQGVPLKAATAAVSEELGRPISDDTLRRAIGKRT